MLVTLIMAKESIKHTSVWSCDLLQNRILFWLKLRFGILNWINVFDYEQKHLLVLVSFASSAAIIISSLICQAKFFRYVLSGLVHQPLS